MSTDKTTLGDSQKQYEDDRRFMPMLPIIARLDGRAFHSFCKNLRKPFDARLTKLMVEVTKYLVDETQARMGYTQSDEITLVWYSDDPESQVFFDGRVAKMISVLASMATLRFNKLLPTFLPEKAHLEPLFDCRVFQVPTTDEAANNFLWRERDATKNSISAAGQVNFSHKELQGKHGGEIQDMLHELRGINWNDYPAFFRRGTYVQKRRVVRAFTATEIDKLPAKHAARTNPDLQIERWEIRVLDMPPFSKVTNRVAVIFEGADPGTGAGPDETQEQWRGKRAAALDALEEKDIHQRTAELVMGMPPRSTMTGFTRSRNPLWDCLIPIQEMPTGATPIYAKDPDPWVEILKEPDDDDAPADE